MQFCQDLLARDAGELTSLKGNAGYLQPGEDDDDAPDFVSVQQLNRIRSLAKAKAESKELIIAETEETCFYFYQAVSGENFFLDPLCLRILQHQKQVQFE